MSDKADTGLIKIAASLSPEAMEAFNEIVNLIMDNIEPGKYSTESIVDALNAAAEVAELQIQDSSKGPVN